MSQLLTTPQEVLSVAMDMSSKDKTLRASIIANPQLAVMAANLFMETYPNAQAGCGTIKNLRTALRGVKVEDTEQPYTLIYLKVSRSFILGRATPNQKKEEELTPEQREELDLKALEDIISRQGKDFLLNFLLAQEAIQEAA